MVPSRSRRRVRRTCRARRRTPRWSVASRCPACARADRGLRRPQRLRLPQLLGRHGVPGRRDVRRRHPQWREPQQVAFIPAVDPYYHGEGAHALAIETPQFTGDLLAVNNETYGSNVVSDCDPDEHSAGGFDLYDVTDPVHPMTLVQGAGDPTRTTPSTPERRGELLPLGVRLAGRPARLSRRLRQPRVHRRRHLRHHRPREPRGDRRQRPPSSFPGDPRRRGCNGGTVLHHDVVVKQIGGKQIMKSTTGTPATSSSTSPTRRTRSW